MSQPYPTPESGAAPASAAEPDYVRHLLDQNPAGIWQNKKMLVVYRKTHHFPPVCMKRCESYQGKASDFHFKYSPMSTFLGLVFGLVGAALGQLFAKTHRMSLPISPEFYEYRRTSLMWGTLWTVLGFLFAILVFFVVISLEFTVPARIYRVLMPLSLLTFALPVGLILSMFRGSVSLITVAKMDKHFIWLRNVSPQYRAQFPFWPR